MTPEQEAELTRLLAPRPQESLQGLEGIENDVGLRRIVGAPPTPLPYEPITQSYTMTPDPLFASAPLPNAIDDGLAPSLSPQELPEYSGPGSMFTRILGLTRERAPQFDLSTEGGRAAKEYYDFQSQLSPLDRFALRKHGGASQFLQQRQTRAQQVAQLEETKRQNQWEDLFKVIGNEKLSPPQAIELLKGMAKQNPFAAEAAQTINDKMIGDFKTWQTYLPRKPEEYEQGLKSGQITWPQVAAEIDAAKSQGMEETKALAKETATQRKIQGLLTKFKQDPNAMTDTELDLVDQHFKQQQERALKIQQLQVGIQGLRADLTKKQNAPSEVYSGIQGPQGESVTGVYDPKTGTTRELRGTPIQRTQDLTATERGAMVEERAVLKQISELDKLYNKEYVGQFDNLIASAKETAPGVFGPIKGEEELFRKTLNQIVTNARRIDAGTAQSVSELAQLAKTYPDLGQHESVFKPAVEAMRNRITARLEARSRLAAEIASGRQKPLSLSDRASQLATLVSTPGFAKDADDAKRIAQDILREELKLGIVKAD